MGTIPRHILVFRFSALGDIAMTVPVLKCMLRQHPELEVTMVSIPFAAPLFEGIERLHFFPADIRTTYAGIPGLQRLARRLKKDVPFDAIADLHDVVRTKLLRFFLLSFPKKVIDKGRAEKKQLTRAADKKLYPLKSTFERYADVFAGLGIPVILEKEAGYKVRPPAHSLILQAKAAGQQVIGIAPFAKHAAKMYPADRMQEVAMLLATVPGHLLLLIGSQEEAALMDKWQSGHNNIRNIAGVYPFKEELTILSGLDVLISMDSANMHFASLFGVPVISVWGGTHPYLGFYGWGQAMENAVQADLPCRPSSVFGNKPCPVHGAAGCMQSITPDMIAGRVQQVLNEGKKNNPQKKG